MAIINIYLHSEGNTEEAFNFYKSIFGGEFATFVRYSDIPNQSGFPAVSDGEKEKIMHVALPIGNENVLMGADILESMCHEIKTGNNFSISIATESREETERLFNGLAAGGKVTMPLAKTFWSEYFGMCVDKFGILWMVNFDLNPSK
ncbi:MAG: VOC family protein [Acidobacteriota bacterium]|nr:VOC family protein [Acidobacteriota bacterium]